jgi:hypothetical protein
MHKSKCTMVSTTPEVNFFIATFGVVDTSGKFDVGVVYTGDK